MEWQEEDNGDKRHAKPGVLPHIGRKLIVDISSMDVSNDPGVDLITYSLGSCLGVAVYDPVIHVGGILHAMLPLARVDSEKARDRPCMFVDTGMMLFLKTLFDRGVRKSRAVVKLAGCASVLDTQDLFRIGHRNYAVCRKILWKNDMLIADEDIGGTASRTIRLELDSGRFFVKSGGETCEL